MNRGLECERCLLLFDPIAARWRCPWCGYKANCCEGAPLPPTKETHAPETV